MLSQVLIMISIIIPFRDRALLLQRCIESIYLKTITSCDFEIIIIDNQSRKESTKKILKILTQNYALTALTYKHPFNYAAINNFAVQYAKGEYYLFLNNDTEVISRDWLNLLLKTFADTGVGAVGAKLLYPNNTIQHSGISFKNNYIGHTHKKLKNNQKNTAPFNKIYEPDAITGACMLTPRAIFQKVGGFDEINLPVAYNDVDYCLKVREAGYKILYQPKVVLYHYESATRVLDKWTILLNRKRYKQFQSERRYIKNRWGV